MPLVSIKTGVRGQDGQDKILTEYICDWPDCGKVAEQVLGVVRDLGHVTFACKEHAPETENRAANPRAG